MATNKKRSSPASTANAESDSTFLKQQTLGRYQLQRKLGAGGMGAVYLALDSLLNRLVALKVLPPEKAENPVLVKRFKAEAQAVAQLTNDNIVRVYESGELNGYHYIALEYVEGTDVQRLIKKRGRLPVRRATEIVYQVALALQHAHQAGIVHRDIKPANMLINQAGIVKLTDLGLARVMDESEETSITRAGTTVGTVDYMAPEQARSSKAADIRSDIYSLGCAWYHMLTGTPPYPEGSVTNKLHAHASSRFPDPRSINEGIPEAVVSVIQRMMAKKPEDRHQTPQELIEDLKAVKLSKKEISADDLAALAGGEEESAVAAPTSQQKELQDAETTVDKPLGVVETPAKKAKSGGKSGSDQLPPRERRQLEEVEGKKQLNLEPLVYIGIACVVIAVIGTIGYMASGVGTALDQNEGQQVNLMEVAQQEQENRQAEGQNGGQSSEEQTLRIQQTEAEKAQQAAAQNASNSVNSSATSGGKSSNGNAAADEMTKNWPVIQVVDAGTAVNDQSAHSVAEALQKQNAKELVIEFQTRTPYVWEEPILVDGRTLVLRAAESASGQILVRSTGALTNGLITMRKGKLFLRGLHFGLLGYDLPGHQELKVIRAVDSDVIGENCSWTLEETRAAPVLLCDFSLTRNTARECRWQHCLLRGAGWKPFLLTGQRMTVTLQSCLIAVGTQPVFTLEHTTSNLGLDATDEVGKNWERTLSLLDSLVFCAGTPLIVNNSPDDISIPPTQFRSLRSNFIATAPTAQKPFLEIRNWPENVLSTAGTAKLSHLEWVSEASRFQGWNRRLLATTNRTRNTFTTNSDAQWQEFWGTDSVTGEWSAEPLTAAAQGDSAASAEDLLQNHAIISKLRLEEGTLAELTRIPVPTLPELTWRAGWVKQQYRPIKLPDSFGNSPKPLTVDLNRQDLGEFLASQTLPDVCVIQAKGFGLRTCTPLRIANKKVKIQFLSDRGRPPLTLRPVPKKGDTSGKNLPWIRIENGELTLESGVFRLDPPQKNPLPSQWLEAINADVRLQKCYVTASLTPQPELLSLVKASRPAEINSRANVVVIDQCYLQYGGTGVQVDLRGTQLAISQSVLVSQNHLLTLQHAGGENALEGLFELTKNTFSSRYGAIHFDIASSGQYQKPLVNGFVTECVFAPPVGSEAKQSSAPVVSSVFPVSQLPERVWWWGLRNGFAPQVSGPTAGKPLEKTWLAFWGDAHVQQPLFGAEGVLLKEKLPEEKNLRPSSFTLYAQSAAAKWAEGDKPIGAPTTTLDLSDYEADQPTTPGTQPGKPKGTPTVPRF